MKRSVPDKVAGAIFQAGYPDEVRGLIMKLEDEGLIAYTCEWPPEWGQYEREHIVKVNGREAALLFDELAYATVDPSPALNRYEKDMSKMAVKVQRQLTDQGVKGELACSK